MSKKSKSKIRTRVFKPNTTRSVRSGISKTNLRVYEDRRLWHPERLPDAKSFSQTRHRLRMPRVSNKVFSPTLTPKLITFPTSRIAFSSPRRILICVRRGIRKQVLHALKKTGKRGQRRPRFNAFSRISCKG